MPIQNEFTIGSKLRQLSINLADRVSAQIVLALCASCASVIGLFLWQGDHGFSLYDEGFLWYGAQRTLAGDVPIRDFMAYDPGRYYWSAALMGVLGDNGVIGLRKSVATFQLMGLFIGLLVALRTTASRFDLPLFILATLTLVLWMFPRHKLFDVTLSIALIGTLTFAVEVPSNLRFLVMGVIVGVVAVFGRNHGIYGVIGSAFVFGYLWFRQDNRSEVVLKRIAVWAGGLAIGYLPVLALIIFVPGFAHAFWETIRFLFELKATNLTLPIPWPWSVPVTSLPLMEAVSDVLAGLFFLALIIFGASSIVWVIHRSIRREPVPPAFVASAALSLPYAHFAFSRADVGHLSQGIFPFLLGCFVLLRERPAFVRFSLAALLSGASVVVMLPVHPGWLCRVDQQCIEANVAGRTLKVDRATASDILMLTHLVNRFAPQGRSFLVAPFWPGAYAVFGRKSPVWEIYALFPRSEAFQRLEIDRIKNTKPGFVFVLDYPLDGRDDLRFRNTHALVDRYIRETFKVVSDYVPPVTYYQIYEGPRQAE